MGRMVDLLGRSFHWRGFSRVPAWKNSNQNLGRVPAERIFLQLVESLHPARHPIFPNRFPFGIGFQVKNRGAVPNIQTLHPKLVSASFEQFDYREPNWVRTMG